MTPIWKYAALGILFVCVPFSAPIMNADEEDVDGGNITAVTLFEKYEAALAMTGRIEIRYRTTKKQVETEYVWIESGDDKFLQPIEKSPTDTWFGDHPTFFTHAGSLFSTNINAEHLSQFAPKSLAESLDSGCLYTRRSSEFNWDLGLFRRFGGESVNQGRSGQGLLLRSFYQNQPNRRNNVHISILQDARGSCL